jgi:hypothetical protein
MASLDKAALEPVLLRELGMATLDLTRLPFGASSQTYSVITTKDGKQQKLCA